MHLFSCHIKAKFTNNGCKGVIPDNASLHVCHHEHITKSEHGHWINVLCTCTKKSLWLKYGKVLIKFETLHPYNKRCLCRPSDLIRFLVNSLIVINGI
jgi:hypothetical protein